MARTVDPFSITPAGAAGLVAKVLSDYNVLHLHADGEDGEHTYSVVAVRDDGGTIRRVTATHPTMLGLFRCLAVGGRIEDEPTRRCPKCNTQRRSTEFAKDVRGPSGLRRMCRRCEAARVAAYTKKKALANLANGIAEPKAVRLYFGRRHHAGQAGKATT